MDQLTLKVPASFAELRDVRHTLEVYRRACPWHVALLLLAIYMFCQARLARLLHCTHDAHGCPAV